MLFWRKKTREIDLVFKRIAKKNHTSPRKVKKEIKKAIKNAWKNAQKETAENQKLILSKRAIPTTEELILHMASRIAEEQAS